MQLHVFVVVALASDELVVRARLAYAALLDEVTGENRQSPAGRKEEWGNSHPVRVLDGRKSVRDGERRAALGSLVERRLHNLLGVGVQSGGSLVKEQDLRVAQQRTRDGDTLLLATRKLATLAADLSVKTAGSIVSKREDDRAYKTTDLGKLWMNSRMLALRQASSISSCVTSDSGLIAPRRMLKRTVPAYKVGS